MEMPKLLELQQQLFFQLNHKVDIYDFPRVGEIVVVKHGALLIPDNIIKVYKYE